MSYVDSLFNLEGKVAVVIGGSGVLGGSMAQTLGRAGSKVAVGYHNNAKGAENVVGAIEQAGGTAKAVQVDTSSEKGVRKERMPSSPFGGRSILLSTRPASIRRRLSLISPKKNGTRSSIRT